MSCFSRLSPEAIAAARETARGFKFSSEQKQLIADLMTPLLEKWAAERAASQSTSTRKSAA